MSDDALAKAITALGALHRWPEQYARMLRWRGRLDEPGHDEERRRDDFYAFFVAAHHLADWIANDATVANDVREAVWKWKLRSTRALAHAADVANGHKHLKREPGRSQVDAAAHVSVYGTFAIVEGDDPPQSWQHAVGVVGNLPREDAYEIADRCIGEWNVFLHEHGVSSG